MIFSQILLKLKLGNLLYAAFPQMIGLNKANVAGALVKS